jgi:hypothetical protein
MPAKSKRVREVRDHSATELKEPLCCPIKLPPEACPGTKPDGQSGSRWSNSGGSVDMSGRAIDNVRKRDLTPLRKEWYD